MFIVVMFIVGLTMMLFKQYGGFAVTLGSLLGMSYATTTMGGLVWLFVTVFVYAAIFPHKEN